jgi:hypothetical protein
MTKDGKPCWYCDNTIFTIYGKGDGSRYVCLKCGTSIGKAEFDKGCRVKAEIKAGKK